MAKGIAHRPWTILRTDCRNERGEIDDLVFRATIENEMVLNVHLMERLGVAIVAGPIRQQQPSGDWMTIGYRFETATVPGFPAKRRASEGQPEQTRLMVGPGGEEDTVAESEWQARLAAGWEFDDEFDDESEFTDAELDAAVGLTD